MTQSIVRGILLIAFTWMISKGWVTQSQVDSALPTVVSGAVLFLTLLGGIVWSYLEKLAKNQITATGKSISPVVSIDLRNLPSDKNPSPPAVISTATPEKTP